MIVLSTKKKTTRFMAQAKHRTYGIQNWLCKNGFCLKEGSKYKVDPQQYYSLIMEFYIEENGDPIGKMNQYKYETFVQEHFNSFCSFCRNKFKK
jgi:hypothetical protein